MHHDTHQAASINQLRTQHNTTHSNIAFKIEHDITLTSNLGPNPIEQEIGQDQEIESF